MDLGGKTVALYGRFLSARRDDIAALVVAGHGVVARDLTLRTHVFVVGVGAATLLESGHLQARLAAARDRKVRVYGERGFRDALAGVSADKPTYPLAAVLTQTGLAEETAYILAAFDIAHIEDGCCRFADVARMRTAAEFLSAGHSLAAVVRTLITARDRAPEGRHKIVMDDQGQPALRWDFGLTTLDGQGRLPLDAARASVEDLFEAAALAEARGDVEEAIRLYDMSARADRSDPIAPFNLGNLFLHRQDFDAAALAYQVALLRDRDFVEARYNLAQAYEAAGKPEPARKELRRALEIDPTHADAAFNLAQLELQRGRLAQARELYERFLKAAPSGDWAEKARKAIAYCSARLAAEQRRAGS